MTETSMPLIELPQKHDEGDFLRAVTEFLRRLKGRGLDGVKLVISFAGQTVPRTVCSPSSPHTGLKAAIRRVFDATWQRCRVRRMRNALAFAIGARTKGSLPKGQHTVVVAAIRLAFNQPDQKAAVEVRRHVADQPRPRWPKLAALMDGSEADVPAYMAFPAQHRSRLHSTNPLEHLNKQVQRRVDVVAIFPNEDSIIRLIGAVLFKQNDDWQSQHRQVMVEAFSQIDTAQTDPLPSSTTQTAWPRIPNGHLRTYTSLTDATVSVPRRSIDAIGYHGAAE